MSRICKLAGMFVLAGLLALNAQAGTQAGDREFGIAASVSQSTESGADPNWNGSGNVSYYCTDQLAVGAYGSVNSYGEDIYGYIGGSVDYHFMPITDNLIPFGGVSLMSGVLDADSDLYVGMRGGLKHFVLERVSINYIASYSTMFEEMSEGIIRFLVGTSLYF